MTQKIKLIRPLRDLMFSNKNISIPERFYGFREKMATFTFTLFYVKPSNDDCFIADDRFIPKKENVLSQYVMNTCDKDISICIDKAENALIKRIELENVYSVMFMGIKIFFELNEIWEQKTPILVYHIGLVEIKKGEMNDKK